MDLEAVAGLADAAYEEFGRLDIVVNNVGGTIPNALLDTDPAYLEEAFHFNVSTAHALTRAAVPQMLKNDGGSIVNISSVVGRVAGRGYLAYGTAKAALAHYTRLAAQDLSPTIRVNAIAVGSVMTSALEFVASDEATMHEMTTKTPLGRVGEVEDISAAVLYLASPAGGFVTGKVLEVDGGLQMPNLDLRLPDLVAGTGGGAPVSATGEAGRRLVDRHRRPARHRRHRRPTRPRAGRRLGLQRRRRSARTPASWRASDASSASSRPTTRRRSSPWSPTASCTPRWSTTGSSRRSPT